MIYLANRRDSIRTHEHTKVQVFSNLDHVTLTVNGATVKGTNGVNKRHWVFEPVILKKGMNKIVATGVSNGKTLRDEMEWTLE